MKHSFFFYVNWNYLESQTVREFLDYSTRRAFCIILKTENFLEGDKSPREWFNPADDAVYVPCSMWTLWNMATHFVLTQFSARWLYRCTWLYYFSVQHLICLICMLAIDVNGFLAIIWPTNYINYARFPLIRASSSHFFPWPLRSSILFRVKLRWLYKCKSYIRATKHVDQYIISSGSGRYTALPAAHPEVFEYWLTLNWLDYFYILELKV